MKAMGRAALILVLDLVILAFWFTSGRSQQTVDKANANAVAEQYFTLLQSENYSGAYQLLAQSHRDTVSLQDFTDVAKDGHIFWTIQSLESVISATENPNKVAVEIRMQVTRDGQKKAISWHPLELSRSSSGEWEVLLDRIFFELLPKVRNERVSKVLDDLGKAWVKRNYAAMAILFDPGHLKLKYGNPPYEEKLRQMVASWELEYGPLEGISCTYMHVRYIDTSTATMPAKFCYVDIVDKQRRFAPYVVMLRLDTISQQWRIIDLQRTATYQRPPESQVLVTPERLKAEEEAIGGR